MIDLWLGVSCDGENCGATGEILGTARAARDSARRDGWAVRVRDPATRRFKDFCPACSRKNADKEINR